MKLLLIFPRVPFPLRDGGAIAMMQMIKGLSLNGADLTLFFLNTSKHYVEDSVIEQQFGKYGEIYSTFINNDVTVTGAVRNLFSTESYHISRFEDQKAIIQFREVLKENSFDLIHFDGLQSSIFLNVARANSSAKCVLRQHNIEHLIWERNAQNATFPKKVYLTLLAKRLKKYEEDILCQFDGVVPISSVDAQFFKKLNKNVCVASTGIEVGSQKVSGFDDNSIFHIGSLDWMPNQEGVKWFLEDVWPLVLSKSKDKRFKLAGRNISKEYSEEVSLNQNTEVVGEVEDAQSFMIRNGVMVVPLKAGSGVRIKILEGLSLGIPIVTTSVGVEGIEIEHNKEVVIADSPEDFADAVCSFDQEKFVSISNNARLFIRENFDNNVISQRLLSFYKSIGQKV